MIRHALASYALAATAVLLSLSGSPAIAEENLETVTLFDGKTFNGWEGDQRWFRIEEGAVVGGTMKEAIPHNCFLCTEKEYGDFELRFQFQLKGKGVNAGVQIRSQRVPNSTEVSGYQADLADKVWGAIWDESRRNYLIAKVDPEKVNALIRPEGEWNDCVVRCEGPRITIAINGTQTVAFAEADDKIPRTGIIGLQIHSGGPSEAWYRNIRLQELPASRK